MELLSGWWVSFVREISSRSSPFIIVPLFIYAKNNEKMARNFHNKLQPMMKPEFSDEAVTPRQGFNEAVTPRQGFNNLQNNNNESFPRGVNHGAWKESANDSLSKRFKESAFKDSFDDGPKRFQNPPPASAKKEITDIALRQLRKVEMCLFHITPGMTCKKGTMCPFAHSRSELQSRPNLEKTAICPSVRVGRECFSMYCKYAHSALELRFSDGTEYQEEYKEEYTCPPVLGPKELYPPATKEAEVYIPLPVVKPPIPSVPPPPRHEKIVPVVEPLHTLTPKVQEQHIPKGALTFSMPDMACMSGRELYHYYNILLVELKKAKVLIVNQSPSRFSKIPGLALVSNPTSPKHKISLEAYIKPTERSSDLSSPSSTPVEFEDTPPRTPRYEFSELSHPPTVSEAALPEVPVPLELKYDRAVPDYESEDENTGSEKEKNWLLDEELELLGLPNLYNVGLEEQFGREVLGNLENLDSIKPPQNLVFAMENANDEDVSKIDKWSMNKYDHNTELYSSEKRVFGGRDCLDDTFEVVGPPPGISITPPTGPARSFSPQPQLRLPLPKRIDPIPDFLQKRSSYQRYDAGLEYSRKGKGKGKGLKGWKSRAQLNVDDIQQFPALNKKKVLGR